MAVRSGSGYGKVARFECSWRVGGQTKSGMSGFFNLMDTKGLDGASA
jgi:hypothetical protein